MTNHLSAISGADVISAHNALDAFGIPPDTLVNRINHLIASYNRNNDNNDLKVAEIRGELVRAQIEIDNLLAANDALKAKVIIAASADLAGIQDRMINAGIRYLDQF